MPNPTDQTFITNEEGRTLLERFRALIQDTKAFDVLVGYFYTSGFTQSANRWSPPKKSES